MELKNWQRYREYTSAVQSFYISRALYESGNWSHEDFIYELYGSYLAAHEMDWLDRIRARLRRIPGDSYVLYGLRLDCDEIKKGFKRRQCRKAIKGGDRCCCCYG